MVYCTKCGTKNDDAARVCVQCGASLETGTYESRRYIRRKAENECFGLPHGGAIAGIVIGAIVLIWGFSMLAKQTGWITRELDIGVIILVAVGALMIIGGIYGYSRRQRY